MGDLAQGVAEDVLGAAKDGSLKELNVKECILLIVIFQRRNPQSTHACRPPRLPLGDGAMRRKIFGPADIPSGSRESKLERLSREAPGGSVGG